MKLAIMQPYFFPHLGYFQALNAVNMYILYHNLSFRKRSWINRNRILLKNGHVHTITVPLIKKSSNKLINEILINNSKPWKGKLYDKDVFAQNEVTLFFVKTDDNLTYYQGHSSFVPSLSIIDVLMHNGREGILNLLKNYSLI